MPWRLVHRLILPTQPRSWCRVWCDVFAFEISGGLAEEAATRLVHRENRVRLEVERSCKALAEERDERVGGVAAVKVCVYASRGFCRCYWWWCWWWWVVVSGLSWLAVVLAFLPALRLYVVCLATSLHANFFFVFGILCE